MNGERGNHMQATADFQQPRGTGALDEQLRQLNAEIVELISAQAFMPGELATEAAVCRAFFALLRQRWNLCCLITYLGDENGRLRVSAMQACEELDGAKLKRAGDWLASRVEGEAREWQVWLADETQTGNKLERDMRRVFTEAGVQAGVALPVVVRGKLAGAIITLIDEAEILRAALAGLRLSAGPVLVALGNARRATEMSEQRHHIERLVEELRQRSTALEDANRELRRVNRYRSLFLARMSHDLRTPLTSILGFTEILLEHGDLAAAPRNFCEKIQSSGFQLQASLNHLVDLSRLEAGQKELFLHEFSLREMLRESCAAVSRLAQKQGVKLDCDTSAVCGTIVSDEGKLRQVLYNFLAYAIGRSPDGGRIGVRLLPHTSSSRVTLEIEDQGEPLADPAHIFEPVDIDAPSESGTNMNELGLAIAHRLIEALGGTITLDTAAPRGLTIRLELPTRPEQK
ncbi:MAG: sensor histidine kinase [Pyrinomonadaceae bacterium]